MFHKWLFYSTLFVLIPVHLHINEDQDNKLIAGYIQCEKKWVAYGGKCYKIFAGDKGSLSWHDASNACKKHGGHLATVQSKEVQEFLFTFLILETDVTAWIGLNDIQEEANYVWDDGTIPNYFNWQGNEPSERRNEIEDCVEMIFGQLGAWNDLTCTNALPYICQVDQAKQRKRSLDPTLCSAKMGGGWKFEDSCYNYVKEEMTWEDAEKYCQSQYQGHLVKVLNFNVNHFLKYVMSNFSVWIGIKIKDDIEQHFSSGWNVRYTYWREYPKKIVDGTCVIQTKETLWEIVSCSEKFPFICEKSTVSKPVLKKPPEGSKCPEKQGEELDIWMDFGGEFCYFIDRVNQFEWHQAHFECVRRGGSLLSIHSKEEIDVLVPYVRRRQSPHQPFLVTYFNGLYRSPTNRSAFLWADGSPKNYEYWTGGEPSDEEETRVEMRFQDLKWNDVIPNVPKGYMCSARKTSPKVEEAEADCDCISGLKLGIFIGVTTVSLLLVVILFSMMIRVLRSCKTKRRKKPTVAAIPLQTLDMTRNQEMSRSDCEKCRNGITHTDCYHIYEYLDMDDEYEIMD